MAFRLYDRRFYRQCCFGGYTSVDNHKLRRIILEAEKYRKQREAWDQYYRDLDVLKQGMIPFSKPESFYLGETELIVSDPCYDLGTWCQVRVPNCHPGWWRCQGRFDNLEGRVQINRLCVWHEGIYERGQSILWEKAGEAGVDAGTIGVFPTSTYNPDSVFQNLMVNWVDPPLVYDPVPALPKEPDSGLKVSEDCGVYTHTRYGDGSYPVLIGVNKDGDVMGIVVDLDPKVSG